MTLDHINAAILERQYFLLSFVGRLAYPVFLYLAVYNFQYRTHDKVAYILRLYTFAIISELPFKLALDAPKLNILFALATGLLMLSFLEERRYIETAIVIPVFALFDYGIYSAFAFIATYFYLENKKSLLRSAAFFLAITFLNNFIFTAASYVAFLCLHFAEKLDSIIPYKPSSKYFMYAFYPIHLSVLAIIRHFIF